MSKLRSIKVTYSDGSIICTSMAAHLTDEQMLKYFEVGTVFNIGSLHDNLQTIVKSEILK